MKIIKQSSLRHISLIFLLLTFIFGRVFMGLNVLSFRLGEILMGFFAVYLITISILNFRNITKESKLEKFVQFTFTLIILHFLYLTISNGYEFYDLYPFKSSSYIWVLGGYYIGKKSNYNFSSKKSIYSMFVALVISYFSSIFGITNKYQDIILNFTDKFDYLKASDLLIFFIFFIYHALKSSKDNFAIDINYLLIFTIFYFPLMLQKSRGASIAFIYIIMYLLYVYMKNKPTVKNILIIIPISILVFITSAFIVSKSPLELGEIDEKIIYISTGRYDKPIQNTPQYFDDYPIIYVKNARVFSSDGNLNWRLQIWQDVFSDMKLKNLRLIGYGYNFKIPAMDFAYRSGNDGTNENVHNYFINLFARGGAIHLFLFTGFFYTLLTKSREVNKLGIFLLIIIPAMFTAFFDPAMENAHFPLIFYYLLGNVTRDKVN